MTQMCRNGPFTKEIPKSESFKTLAIIVSALHMWEEPCAQSCLMLMKKEGAPPGTIVSGDFSSFAVLFHVFQLVGLKDNG